MKKLCLILLIVFVAGLLYPKLFIHDIPGISETQKTCVDSAWSEGAIGDNPIYMVILSLGKSSIYKVDIDMSDIKSDVYVRQTTWFGIPTENWIISCNDQGEWGHTKSF